MTEIKKRGRPSKSVEPLTIQDPETSKAEEIIEQEVKEVIEEIEEQKKENGSGWVGKHTMVGSIPII